MNEFSLVINIFLFAIGIALIVLLVAKQKEHPVLMRAVMLFYFLVVMQYNSEWTRFTADKLLLTSAAFCFVMWVRQPTPSAD